MSSTGQSFMNLNEFSSPALTFAFIELFDG